MNIKKKISTPQKRYGSDWSEQGSKYFFIILLVAKINSYRKLFKTVVFA